MNMVEKMMMAMSKYADSLPETSMDAPFIRSHRKGLALAALNAMREPTFGMMCAEGGVTVGGLAVYRSMIEAAIAEAPAA